MMRKMLNLILSSLKFYTKPVLYQLLMITLLSAIITGSLLVGTSVRESLRKSSLEHLGNTGILISSGTRFFRADLVRRLSDSARIPSTGILQLSGYSQNLTSQKAALNTNIFGIDDGFFQFHGSKNIKVNPGEIAINKKLAEYLGTSPGDEIIVKYTGISDIPSDAPFAPSSQPQSKVMKVGMVIDDESIANFSLSVTQLTPMNIFINLADMEDNQTVTFKINRILIDKKITSAAQVGSALSKFLKSGDIGLKLRSIKRTGGVELNSDRVFIDELLLNEATGLIPGSAPVLTYLANRFTIGGKSTPYSFVAALPSSLYPGITSGSEIIINSWMAADLSAKENDTIRMFWYAPDSLNKLTERSSNFRVKKIVEMKGIWADSLFMPDFPGISGKESCSEWDAGVPIKLHEIRPRDEDYWNKYRGTPKAFISYEKGKELWGNNFGPATAMRFPPELSAADILNKLRNKLDPEKTGFTITDLAGESVAAASESVDFGTLFLSLGFFLIVASMVLLSFAASAYFDSGRKHLRTLHALGFRNRWISRMLLFETGLISLAGCLTGAFGGYIVNIIITAALNSVWQGAVQINTLKPYFSLLSVILGFSLSYLTIMIMMLMKTKRFMSGLNEKKNEIYKKPSYRSNSIFLFVTLCITILSFTLTLTSEQKILWSYAGGTALLLTFIFVWRHFYARKFGNSMINNNKRQLSRSYYSLYPSNAVLPILFIAAGIFTVFVTGANRMNFNDNVSRSSGTGGYLFWCENSLPVKEDLNTENGRRSLGLDDDQFRKMKFLQIKRSPGNDASCLNLNHITTPPLLGVDPSDFISNGSFAFSKVINPSDKINPWQYLNLSPGKNIIYGIADQTVLDWGLKLKCGDTLVIRSETGMPLSIIIAAGLQSSVFQGNILIGGKNFSKYYPTVSGSSILLAEGNRESADLYKKALEERLEAYGVNVEKTTDRLASFNTVTNTYLSVFSVFGALGMIVGVIGLGFVLLKNYNQRKQEFALMMAVGFHIKSIRKMILSEQLVIILAGVSSGLVSAVAATLPALLGNAEVPWIYLGVIVVAIVITGVFSIYLASRAITRKSLMVSLKKE